MPTSHVSHVAPTLIGVSYMTTFIVAAVSSAVSFGLGWYIKGRGMAGVKIDLANVKTDIEMLKNKIAPSAPAPTV